MISDALDAFLAGYDRVFGRGRVGVTRQPVKVIG